MEIKGECVIGSLVSMEEVYDPTDPLSVTAQVIQRNRSMLLITTPRVPLRCTSEGRTRLRSNPHVYTAKRVFLDTS